MRWASVLVVLGLVVYANAARAPFIFDDIHAIVENPHVRHVWPPADAASAPPQTALSGRPLISLSLALNYAFGGPSPTAFHLWNLGVHIAGALLLFAIVRRHMDDPFAWLVAALWMVHPLQTEVVDYTTQRTESMMGLLYLATLYASIRGWTVTALVCCAAGMAAKESMVTAPLMVLAYDATFNERSIGASLSRRPWLYAGLSATWIVLCVLNAGQPRSETAGFSSGPAAFDYLLNQAVMITRYLRLIIWPHPLILDYGPVRHVTMAEVWLPFVFVLILVGGVALLWRTRPPLAFLGAWFFVTLSPSSSVVPIASEVGAERRMYLPLAAAAVLGVVALRRWCGGRRLHALPIGVLAVAILASLTVRRNAQFNNPIALWSGVVEHWPHGRARHALAFALQQAGRREDAIAEYRRAAVEYPLARYNLALQLAASGKTDEAVVELRARLRGAPSDPDARGALADLLLRQQRFAQAAAEYAAYLLLVPGNAAAHNNYGLALVQQNRVADAVREFRTALALSPSDPGASRNLARALMLLTSVG